MLELIAQLYGIEKQIREGKYKPDKIKTIRSEASIPILKKFDNC
jgi:hypothetical protein